MSKAEECWLEKARKKIGAQLTNGSSLNEAEDQMKCIVEGCSTRGLPPDNNYCLTRHRVIPWMRALGYSTENATINYDNYICQKHFDQSQYNDSNLKLNAVPTLHLRKNKRSQELNVEEIDHEFALAHAIIKVEKELEVEEMPFLNSYYSQLLLFHDLIPNKKELAWRLDLLGVKYKEDDLSEETNAVVDICSKQSAPVFIEAPTYFETTLIDDPDDEFVEDEPAYINPSRLMQEIETYETESATEINIKQEIQIYEPEPITEIKQEIQINEPENFAEVELKPHISTYLKVKPVEEIMIIQKEEYILPKRKNSANRKVYDNDNDDDPMGEDDDDVDDPDYKDVDDPEYDFMDDDDDPDYDPNDDDYDDILYKNKNKNLKQIGNKKWPKLNAPKVIETVTISSPKCEIQPKIEIKKELNQPIGNQQIQTSGNQRIQTSVTQSIPSSVNQITKPSGNLVEETKKVVSEKMLTEIKVMDEKIQSQVKHIITKIDSAVRQKGVAPTLEHYFDQVKRISNANISKEMLKRQLTEDNIIFIDDEDTFGEVDFVSGQADSELISEIRNIENRVRYTDKVPELEYFCQELDTKFKSKLQFSEFPFTEKMVLNWLNEMNIQCQDNLSKYPSLDYFYMELESRGYICPKPNIAIVLKQIKIKFWEEDGLPPPEKFKDDKDALATALFDINTQFYKNKELEEYVQIEGFRVVHPKKYVTKCIAKSEYHFYSEKETPTEEKFCQRITEEFGDICSKNVMKQWLSQLGVGNRNPRGFKDIPTLDYFCEQLAKQHDQKYSKYLVRKWLIESSIVFEYEELDPLEKEDSTVKAPGVTLLLKNLNADYYKIDSEIIQTIRRVERGDNKFKVTPNFSAIYEELCKAQSDLTIEKVEIWLKRLMVKYIPDNSQLTTLNKKLCYPCLVPPLDYFYERLVDKLGVFPKKSLKKWLDHLTILYYPSDTPDDLLEENITLNVDIVKMLLELENEHESFSDVTITDIIRPIGMNFKGKKTPTLDYIYKYVQSAKLFCNKKSQYADCKDTLKHWLKVLRIDYTDADDRTKTAFTPLVSSNVSTVKPLLAQTTTSSPGTKLNSTEKTGISQTNAVPSGNAINSSAQIPLGTKLIKLTDCPTLKPIQTETTNGNRTPTTTQTGSAFPQMVISDIRSVSPAVGSPTTNQAPANPVNMLKPADSKGVMVIPREVKTLLREGFFKNIKREFYARNQQPSLDYIHAKLKEKDYFFSKMYLKKLLNYLNISFEDSTDLSNEQDDSGSNNSAIIEKPKDKEVVKSPSNANKNETNAAKPTTRDTGKRKANSETSEVPKKVVNSPPCKRRGRPRKVDQEKSKAAETTKSKTNPPSSKTSKATRGKRKSKGASAEASVIEIGDSDDDTGNVASKKRKVKVPDVIEIPDEEPSSIQTDDNKTNEKSLMSVFDEVRAEFFKKSGVPKFNDFYTRVIEYFGDQYSSDQVKEGLKEYAENLKR